MKDEGKKIKAENNFNRRDFCKTASVAAGLSVLPIGDLFAAEKPKFQLNYILSSAMYGTTELSKIVPEVEKIGANAIDIWPRPHGNQWDQVEKMGPEKFCEMLTKHHVNLGAISSYKFGSLNLKPIMEKASQMCGQSTLFVVGGTGPKDLKGDELKAAVKKYAEQLKPHIEMAFGYGYTIAVENHGNNLIDSPDSCKWLLEFTDSENLGIAFAPHHFENLNLGAKEMAKLVHDFGDKTVLFYAQQHGNGSKKKLPKDQELLQMPGRGKLDFKPIMQALKKINYQSVTEIFMHPVPRGVPILPTVAEITAEINKSRAYLEKCLE